MCESLLEVKLCPNTRREGIWGSGGRDPPIVSLGTGSWVVTFTLRPLYPREEPRYTFNRRLGGPQRGSGHYKKRQNPLVMSNT